MASNAPNNAKMGELFPDLHHKMSKKIAQLTKVIYHLNTKNEVLTHSLTHSLTDLLTHLLIYSLTHSPTHSLTYSLAHYILAYSFNR